MEKPVTIKDKELKCNHCGKNDFDEVTVKLNTRAGAWFPILEVAGATGTAYICTNCGLKQEFYNLYK